MTVAGYWRIFARQWFLIVLMTVLCVGGAAAYSALATPSYSATARLFVAARLTDGSAVDLQAGSTYTTSRVASYPELADSPQVLSQVIQELDLPYSVQHLAGEISATVATNTVNIEITVKDPNAARATNIASTFAKDFAAYITSIESVDTKSTTVDPQTGASTTKSAVVSPVQISITKEPTRPTAPDSPKTTLNLILGLFVGLGLGLVVAVVREQTNSYIIGVPDIERVTGSVPLGVVPVDRSTHRHPLVRPSDQSGRAEAFRGLRTNLQFADVDNPPGRIVITSAVPGEGKSTVTANIGLTLAVGGARVALVEADLREPQLSNYLGITNAAGLTNVLAGQYTLSEVLIRHPSSPNLAVLTSGPKPPNPAELLNSTQMENLLILLGEHFDYVVVDSPPLLRVTEAAVLAAIADGALVVVHNRRTKREELSRAVSALTTVNARVLGTVLNFAPVSNGSWYGYGYGSNKKDPRHADFFMPQGNMFNELGEALPDPDPDSHAAKARWDDETPPGSWAPPARPVSSPASSSASAPTSSIPRVEPKAAGASVFPASSGTLRPGATPARDSGVVNGADGQDTSSG